MVTLTGPLVWHSRRLGRFFSATTITQWEWWLGRWPVPWILLPLAALWGWLGWVSWRSAARPMSSRPWPLAPLVESAVSRRITLRIAWVLGVYCLVGALGCGMMFCRLGWPGATRLAHADPLAEMVLLPGVLMLVLALALPSGSHFLASRRSI